MQRDYNTGVADSVIFFIGDEIEQTPAYGLRTLFVVGVHESNDILKLLNTKLAHSNIQHIYFGANQSFPNPDINNAIVWKEWEDMIIACLEAGYWCTLDLDVRCAEGLVEGPLVENRRFIPQLSVKIPYLTQLGYNATIKLDDKGFEASNPGVWCHTLHSLTTRDSFTSWDEYGKDEIIKRD